MKTIIECPVCGRTETSFNRERPYDLLGSVWGPVVVREICPECQDAEAEKYLTCDVCEREEGPPFAPGDQCPMCGGILQERGAMAEEDLWR